MKISKVEFENFRNFKEKCCITFPTDGSVTVIYGPNGVGKTTLHQLFQWIFYGEVHFNKTASKEMYNLDYEMEVSANHVFSVWGIIDFEHPNSDGTIEKYSIRREWVYRKELAESRVVDRKIRISKDVGAAGGKSNWVTLTTDADTATKLIEQILPSGLSQYFFFDGESMIADLGRTGKDSAKSLRKALFSIFDLDIYEQATVHLGTQDSGSSTVLGKLYLSLAQNSTDKDIILQTGEYRAASKRVEKLNEEIESYKSYIERHRKEAQELSEQIGNAPSRKALEARRKRAKDTIKTLEDSIAGEMKAFGATVMSVYPYLLLSRVVEEAQFRIGLKVEDQTLPRGLTKELVMTLLSGDTCLCGHPITAKERAVLEELKKMFPPLSYKYIYDQFKLSAARWASTYDNEALLNHIERIFKIKDQISGQQSEIHDIDEALKQTGNVDELIAKRAEAEDRVRYWQGKLSTAQQDLGVKERLKSQHKAKLDKLLAASSANKAIQDQIDIMEAVKQHFTTKLAFSATLYSNELCKAIQELLDRMLSGTRRVTVSSRFELSVKDSHGNEAKSEGQFAIVSFAYIGGILKLLSDVPELKGKEFPLVLDGPFSKLDAKHRQNVIDTIPSYAPQVILFSKDDINSCFGAAGPEHVWTIYSNEERNVSTVKCGYDPEVFSANGTEN